MGKKAINIDLSKQKHTNKLYRKRIGYNYISGSASIMRASLIIIIIIILILIALSLIPEVEKGVVHKSILNEIKDLETKGYKRNNLIVKMYPIKRRRRHSFADFNFI